MVGRNRRTVWNIATAPYSGAHFATFPPALVEPCIKAGTSEAGCCPSCGAQWVRVIERFIATERHTKQSNMTGQDFMQGWNGTERRSDIGYNTLGFRPSCDCPAHEPIPCTVFDPFAGSGTTLMVARQLGRNALATVLSFAYLHDQARRRLSLDALEEWQTGGKDGKGDLSELPLFAEMEEG